MNRALLVAASLTVGCNAVSGLDGLTFVGDGGSAGAGMGGAGGAGGEGGMAGGAGGGGGAPSCGAIGALADAFDDGLLSDAWQLVASGTTNVTEASGHAKIAVSALSDNCYGLDSTFRYDFRGSEIRVELPAGVPDGAVAELRIDDGLNSAAIVRDSNGMLRFAKTIASLSSSVLSLPYSAANQRFWRIRESAGSLSWSVSADGVDWTDEVSQSVRILFPLELVRVRLSACGSGQLASDTTVDFDNVQGLPESTHCSADTFSDDFDDNIVDAHWSRSSGVNGGSGSEVGGQFVMHLQSGQSGVSYMHESGQAFDLRESAFAIEVVQPVVGPSAISWFEVNRYDVDTGAEHYIGFNLQDGMLYCEYNTGSGMMRPASVQLSPTAHRWWRIRESGGTFFWETSSEGSDWDTITAVNEPMPLDRVDVEFAAQRDTDTPVLDVIWDNLNHTP